MYNAYGCVLPNNLGEVGALGVAGVVGVVLRGLQCRPPSDCKCGIEFITSASS